MSTSTSPTRIIRYPPARSSRADTTSVVPNNTNFTTDRILQTFWVGARYSVRPDLDLALAYYHENQNSFVIGNGSNPTGTCNTVASAGCSGSLDAVSFVADWRFAKHFDAYAGVMWSQVQNGLANGFLQANGLPGATGNKASAYDPALVCATSSDDCVE